eukprot:PhM_4_TR16436/c0_g1_i1/m.24882
MIGRCLRRLCTSLPPPSSAAAAAAAAALPSSNPGSNTAIPAPATPVPSQQQTTTAAAASPAILSLGKVLQERDNHAVLKIVDAYSRFWDHIRFRKGWAVPPFQLKEVISMLQESAEYVVRIRRYLDETHPGMKMRQPDGQAQDALHSMTDAELKDPTKFIRRLVHANLKDALGYVEGLTEKAVDDMLQEMIRHRYYAKVQVEVLLHEVIGKVLNSSITSDKFWSRIFDAIGQNVYDPISKEEHELQKKKKEDEDKKKNDAVNEKPKEEK